MKQQQSLQHTSCPVHMLHQVLDVMLLEHIATWDMDNAQGMQI